MENEKLTPEEINTIPQFIRDVDEDVCAQIWTHINDATSPNQARGIDQPSAAFEDIASFWRAKELSVRASNCLAKADIPDEKRLVEQLTRFTDVIALRNCGRLTADEIWTFIAARKAGLDRVEIPVCYENLSNRAKNALAKQGITDENQLLEQAFTRQELLGLRGVGRQTCDEIWALIQELQSRQAILGTEDASGLADPEGTQTPQLEIQILLEDAQHVNVPGGRPGERLSQDLQRDIPLLKMRVTQKTWEQLQKTPVSRISWSVRAQNIIDQKGLKTLADLTQISTDEWLTFKNFSRISFAELKQKIAELIGAPEALESLPLQCEVPLLDVTVSEEIFNVLQNTSIYQTRWSRRIEDAIYQQGCQTLAEIAAIPPLEWLKLKNFGQKSLTEIQAKVQAVIENPLPSPLNQEVPDNETALPIQSLSELGFVAILQRLREREQVVIKLSYGYEEMLRKLNEIGEMLGVSRKRVRKIKDAVNEKIRQGAEYHLIRKAIPNIFGDSIRNHLSTTGGVCSIDVLRQKMGWNADEQWLVNWFDEVLGETWFCIGAESYEVVDGVCYLKSEHGGIDFFAELVIKLQHFGYRPLTIGQCHELHQTADESPLELEQLMATISNHPELKVYQYGETYIGLKDWTWFNPEKPTTIKGQADLIEWFLRLTNEPASAKRIADEIPRKLGHFRLTPFEVADVCERQPHRFHVDAEERCALSLWQDVALYRSNLEQLLATGSLPIQQIVERLSAAGTDDTDCITAALNRYHEVFVEIAPFEWALKLDASQDADYQK